MDLIYDNLWLKQRKDLLTGDCTYSLKEITLYEDHDISFSEATDKKHPYIRCTEERDKEKIEERIGKRIDETEEYVVLHVTRWSQRINGVYFYIDSARSEMDKSGGVSDWYVTCGCTSNDLNAIEKCFQQLNIQKESLVHHTPTLVIEHLQKYFPEEIEELELLSELHETETWMFHRRADPLDMNLTLPMDACKEEVATWCNNILNGKFADEFQKITEGLDGASLYRECPQDIIERAQRLGLTIECGTALFFYVHLWQSPMRHSVEELIALAREDLNNISLFTLYEIRKMQRYCEDQEEIIR